MLERAATTADQYPWFSMTKIATATAVLRMVHDGIIEPDAPVSAYLRDYTGPVGPGPHPDRLDPAQARTAWAHSG